MAGQPVPRCSTRLGSVIRETRRIERARHPEQRQRDFKICMPRSGVHREGKAAPPYEFGCVNAALEPPATTSPLSSDGSGVWYCFFLAPLGAPLCSETFFAADMNLPIKLTLFP